MHSPQECIVSILEAARRSQDVFPTPEQASDGLLQPAERMDQTFVYTAISAILRICTPPPCSFSRYAASPGFCGTGASLYHPRRHTVPCVWSVEQRVNADSDEATVRISQP
jgi:hypothetical protein